MPSTRKTSARARKDAQRSLEAPARKKAPARVGREEILKHACACFAEQDAKAVSLQEIASRAGVTVPAILHHFKTKQKLFEEVVETLDKPLKLQLELLEGFLPKEGGTGGIDQWVSMSVRLMLEHRDLWRILVRRLLTPDPRSDDEDIDKKAIEFELVKPLSKKEIATRFRRATKSLFGQANVDTAPPSIEVWAVMLAFYGLVLTLCDSDVQRELLGSALTNKESGKELSGASAELQKKLIEICQTAMKLIQPVS